MRGVGIDIASIDEFCRIINDPTTSFITKYFTSDEQDYANNHVSGSPENHLAARYAAKEAVIKAVTQAGGALFAEHEVNYLEIEVQNGKNGVPYLNFSGDFEKIVKKVGISSTLLTLSHDKGMAIAFVIVE